MKPKKDKQPHGGALLSVLVLTLLVLISITATLGFAAYSAEIDTRAVKVMKSIVETDVIYENIFINGVKVGGMGKDEAAAYLYDMYQRPVNETRLVLTDNGTVLAEIPFTRFNARYDIYAAVDAAWIYGRGASLDDRYVTVRNLMREPYELQTAFSYDEALLVNALESIASRMDKPPVNASIVRQDRQFYTTRSQIGTRFDVEKTLEKLKPIISSVQGGVVEAVIETVTPDYTELNFDTAQTMIGTYSTSFSGGDAGRNQNLATAAEKLNDVVVYPGEIFSTNEAFGEMTYANGYRMAPVIMDGRIESGMGGGICQVSSTFYNALLFAELEIVERRNHSLKVAYADYGYDATLVEGAIDLKFRNDTEFPVFIESYIENDKLVVVNIYGHEIHSPDRTIRFVSERNETIPPGEDIVIENPNLPAGTRTVQNPARNGYRYSVYKIIYEKDVEVGRELVNRSNYRAVRGEVVVGTAPDPAGIDMPLDFLDLMNQQAQSAEPEHVYEAPEPAPITEFDLAPPTDYDPTEHPE